MIKRGLKKRKFAEKIAEKKQQKTGQPQTEKYIKRIKLGAAAKRR